MSLPSEAEIAALVEECSVDGDVFAELDALAARTTRVKVACAMCGGPLEVVVRRRDARYCSGGCRQAAYRRRRAGADMSGSAI